MLDAKLSAALVTKTCVLGRKLTEWRNALFTQIGFSADLVVRREALRLNWSSVLLAKTGSAHMISVGALAAHYEETHPHPLPRRCRQTTSLSAFIRLNLILASDALTIRFTTWVIILRFGAKAVIVGPEVLLVPGKSMRSVRIARPMGVSLALMITNGFATTAQPNLASRLSENAPTVVKPFVTNANAWSSAPVVDLQGFVGHAKIRRRKNLESLPNRSPWMYAETASSNFVLNA